MININAAYEALVIDLTAPESESEQVSPQWTDAELTSTL